MKPLVIPALCLTLLSAILSSGLSHWSLLRHPLTILPPGNPESIQGQFCYRQPNPATAPPEAAPVSASLVVPTAPINELPRFSAVTEGLSRQISALTEKINQLETENRDLTAQLAETNSDLMKLEFRVDSHSESFRPLPTTESISPAPGHEIPENDTENTLLPLRAEPVTEEELQQNSKNP